MKYDITTIETNEDNFVFETCADYFGEGKCYNLITKRDYAIYDDHYGNVVEANKRDVITTLNTFLVSFMCKVMVMANPDIKIDDSLDYYNKLDFDQMLKIVSKGDKEIKVVTSNITAALGEKEPSHDYNYTVVMSPDFLKVMTNPIEEQLMFAWKVSRAIEALINSDDFYKESMFMFNYMTLGVPNCSFNGFGFNGLLTVAFAIVVPILKHVDMDISNMLRDAILTGDIKDVGDLEDIDEKLSDPNTTEGYVADIFNKLTKTDTVVKLLNYNIVYYLTVKHLASITKRLKFTDALASSKPDGSDLEKRKHYLIDFVDKYADIKDPFHNVPDLCKTMNTAGKTADKLEKYLGKNKPLSKEDKKTADQLANMIKGLMDL